MAIVGDLAGFKRAQKAIERAAKGDQAMIRRIQTRSIRAMKDLVKEQFAKGIGPDGAPNRQRKAGGPALKSERLARGALDARISGSAVVFFAKAGGRLDRMLEGHQAGVVFPPRKGGGQWLRYNAKGRLVSYSNFLRRTRDAALGVNKDGYQSFVKTRHYKSGKPPRQVFAGFRQQTAAHTVGRRVLPATPVYPAGSTFTIRWERALNQAAAEVIAEWAASVTGTADEKNLHRLAKRAGISLG